MTSSHSDSEIKSTSIFKDLEISPEISEAIQKKRPVVALESVNGFLHGGTTPQQKLETLLRCEQAIIEQGSLPATVGVLNGHIKLGMTREELAKMSVKAYQGELQKVSRRDIPIILSQKKYGAMTVSAAMMVADMTGIKFLSAGGLGGVHRYGQHSFDISQDLPGLSRCNVALICSGSKAIIDPQLTLEYLETQGVPVIGYQTDFYPRFCVQESEVRLDQRLDSAEAIVDVIYHKWSLGDGGGVLIANPVPSGAAMSADIIDVNIAKAIKDMQHQGIEGKACTDYLLDKVNEYTGGKMLDSNIELLVNNARLTAELAVHYFCRLPEAVKARGDQNASSLT